MVSLGVVKESANLGVVIFPLLLLSLPQNE